MREACVSLYPNPKCLSFLLFLRQSHFHIYSLQTENNKGQSHLMT